MPPFQIKKFDHLVLRVADVEACLAFYVDILGCTVDRRRPDLGLDHLRGAGFMIDLVDLAGPLGGDDGAVTTGMPRNLDHFCLQVTPFDAEAITAFLKGHGIAASETAPRYGADGTGLSLYFQDPAGNTIELKGSEAAD